MREVTVICWNGLVIKNTGIIIWYIFHRNNQNRLNLKVIKVHYASPANSKWNWDWIFHSFSIHCYSSVLHHVLSTCPIGLQVRNNQNVRMALIGSITVSYLKLCLCWIMKPAVMKTLMDIGCVIYCVTLLFSLTAVFVFHVTGMTELRKTDYVF